MMREPKTSPTSGECSDSHFSLAHATEVDVRRELLAHNEWQFHSLVVHRMKNGVCLQGVLECENDSERDDICQLVRQVAGVTDVIDQIVVQKPQSKLPPPKG